MQLTLINVYLDSKLHLSTFKAKFRFFTGFRTLHDMVQNFVK